MSDQTSKAIEAIKAHLSPEVLEKLTSEHIFELMKLAGEGKLQAAQLNALVSIAPKLAEVVSNFVEAVPKITAQAVDAQKSALTQNYEIFKANLEALERLAGTTQTDDAKVRIAQIMSDDADKSRKSNEQINRDGQSFLTKALSITASVAGVLGVIGLALVGARGGSKSA